MVIPSKPEYPLNSLYPASRLRGLSDDYRRGFDLLIRLKIRPIFGLAETINYIC